MQTRDLSLVVMAVLPFVGCAQNVQRAPGVPEDFAIDLTVLSAATAEDQASLPAHLRTSRYLLQPGGELHAESGSLVVAGMVPPFTRMLPARDVESLWRAIESLGLVGEAEDDRLGNPELILPTADHVTYIASIYADEDCRTFHRVSALEGESDSAMQSFVRSLAALAWMSDEPVVDRMEIPRRYNFGPDPYARYRAPPAPTDAEEATDE